MNQKTKTPKIKKSELATASPVSETLLLSTDLEKITHKIGKLPDEVAADAMIRATLGDTAIVQFQLGGVLLRMWPDVAAPAGYDMMIIKGQKRLAAIAAEANAAPAGIVKFARGGAKMATSAILCDCIERAVALQQVLGEKEIERCT